MSKHTPAPWNNFKSVIICNQDDAGLQISYVNTSCAERRAEGRANAFLIAAAPDLLKSVEDGQGPWFFDWLADRLTNVYGEDPNTDFVLALRRKASMQHDAIAKAKGESS